jgi:hypothetical protein
MSIAYSIDHLSTSVEDVSVEVAEKSIMTRTSNSIDPKTGENTTVYVLASGDNAYPATVTYRSGIQARSTGPVRRVNITLSTWATSTDSVSRAIVKKPVTASINLLFPADMTIEVADADDLIGNLFSFAYLSVTTKVRDVSWLSDLLYGSPEVK